MEGHLLTLNKLRKDPPSAVLEKNGGPSIAVEPILFGGFLVILVLVGTDEGIFAKIHIRSLVELEIPEIDKNAPSGAGKKTGIGQGWGEIFRTFAHKGGGYDHVRP